MLAAAVAFLVWTGPHSPCVWARPYDGDLTVSDTDREKRKRADFAGGGLFQWGPDSESATVCELPRGKRAA